MQGTPLSPPILARDQDTQVSRPLLLEILGDSEGLFALSDPEVLVEQGNLHQAYVEVSGGIDRERIGNNYAFWVMVSQL